MRRNRWLDTLIILLVIIAGIYLVQLLWRVGLQFAHVLLLFFVAWVIAFLLTPLVEALQRLWLPRLAAAALIYLLLGAGVTVLVLLALPSAVADGNAIVAQAPAYMDQVQEWINWAHQQLTLHGVTDDYLVKWSQDSLTRVQTFSTNLTLNLLSVATAVVAALVNLFIVLVLSFYMILDGRRIVARIVDITPPRFQGKMKLFFASVGESFGAFARAQFLLGLCCGIVTFAVLSLFQVGYAPVAAGLAALGMLLPFLGPFLAIIPPLLFAAFWVSSVGAFIAIGAILWLVQQLLVNVLAPRLLGARAGMHPLLVLFALFAGATLAGVWGAIFGVPVATVAFLMLRDFYHEVLQPSQMYAPADTPTKDEEPVPEERVPAVVIGAPAVERVP